MLEVISTRLYLVILLFRMTGYLIKKSSAPTELATVILQWLNHAMHCYVCCRYVLVKKLNQSHYRLEGPRGFQEVKDPIFHDNGTGW